MIKLKDGKKNLPRFTEGWTPMFEAEDVRRMLIEGEKMYAKNGKFWKTPDKTKG